MRNLYPDNAISVKDIENYVKKNKKVRFERSFMNVKKKLVRQFNKGYYKKIGDNCSTSFQNFS